jgi:hypothetical protein
VPQTAPGRGVTRGARAAAASVGAGRAGDGQCRRVGPAGPVFLQLLARRRGGPGGPDAVTASPVGRGRRLEGAPTSPAGGPARPGPKKKPEPILHRPGVVSHPSLSLPSESRGPPLVTRISENLNRSLCPPPLATSLQCSESAHQLMLRPPLPRSPFTHKFTCLRLRARARPVVAPRRLQRGALIRRAAVGARGVCLW